MAKSLLPPDQVLTLLARTPERIEEAVAGLTPAQLRRAPAPGEWSAVEVLGHLRSCGDVWGDCIGTILAEDDPTLRAVNPTTWLASTDYPSLEFAASWAAYLAQRDQLLRVLRELDHAQWARSATVTGAGRPLQRSALGYADWLATHERSHLRQLRKIADAVRGQDG